MMSLTVPIGRRGNRIDSNKVFALVPGSIFDLSECLFIELPNGAFTESTNALDPDTAT
jgi:hypothetical protein